jgi:ABC-2 type transport system permease protein
MTPRRVRAIARKELLHVLRDPRSLGMAIAIPMLLLVLFGYALTLDVDNVPLVIWDRAGTPASRAFAAHFSASRYFSVHGGASSYAEIERAIDSSRAIAGLVIPADFGGRAAVNHPAEVQVILDGSDANTANLALSYLEATANAYSQEAVLARLHRAGAPHAAAPIDLRPRAWFNADLESRNYIIPGLIAVIMMVIAALLTSLTIAREWERGTMEQLISTPVSGGDLIAGKLLPYVAIGMLDVFLAVMMGHLVFGVPLRGSVLLVFSVSAVFLVGALSLGILISIVTRSQLLASQLAMVLTFLPSFLLSGFMYSISNMPAPVQAITYLVPAKYFVALLKGIYLKGIGLEILGLEALLLVAFSAAVVGAARLRFRKRLV